MHCKKSILFQIALDFCGSQVLLETALRRNLTRPKVHSLFGIFQGIKHSNYSQNIVKEYE